MINVQYLQIVLHLAVTIYTVDALRNDLQIVKHELIVVTLLTVAGHTETYVVVFCAVNVGLAQYAAMGTVVTNKVALCRCAEVEYRSRCAVGSKVL